jgi:biotin-(acetyl-CoA carboxylase) ligase
MDRTVTLVQGEREVQAIPRCVREDGSLEVEIDGEKKVVFSGEVSLRIS